MEKIIGHENEINLLNKAIAEDKIAHAYLFSGREGIGKKIVATNFGEKVIGVNISNLNIIEPENDIIKIEAIRNLIAEIYLKPTDSSKKVFIINDADKMNINAQNALLKVLEEPPIYAVLILITSNKERIINTILSRVTEIKFNSLSNEELNLIIGEEKDYSFARGSAKKALEMKKSKVAELAKEIVEVFKTNSCIDINKKISQVKADGEKIIEILEFVKIYYFNNLREDTYKKIEIIKLIDNTIRDLKRNANEDLALDKLIIEKCRLK